MRRIALVRNATEALQIVMAKVGLGCGPEVAVVGAHGFGLLVFRQEDRDCDFCGAGLHRWILGPIRAGFLHVKKRTYKKIWMLFPAPGPGSEDIHKFEDAGTGLEAVKMAAGETLALQHGLGPDKKETHLRYLQDYRGQQPRKLPRFRVLYIEAESLYIQKGLPA